MALQLAQGPTSEPVLYFPRVSKDIIEQLERQLFRSDENGGGDFQRSRPDEPCCGAIGVDVRPMPTPHDLQAGLILIVQAGVAMNDLRRTPSETATLMDIYEVVSALQRRTLSQEREIDRILGELHDARAEVETSRSRAQAAETRLQYFMSLLGKIISPYARRMVFGAAPPAERWSRPTATGEVES